MNNEHSIDNAMGKQRRILLLQGPVGPFFRILAEDLRSEGFGVDHVLFNSGDLLYAGRRDTIVFRDNNSVWQEWISHACRQQIYAAIVLFGCQRDRHEIARELAEKYDVPLLSLEEGYVRPGYITAEAGGNNIHSPLAKLPVSTFATWPETPRPKRTKGKAHGTMINLGAWYYIARALGSVWFRRVHHHKKRHALPESLLWIRNLYRKKTRFDRNRKLIAKLTSQYEGRFFIVPLQVHDDLQCLKCGRGWTNETVVEKAISSFAMHAAADHVLVIKAHPMERGHTSIDRLVRRLATEQGCSDRIFFLDDGVMGALTRVSAGMVTINSTSAFSAMLHGVRLAVLGDAMFAHPDLVNRIDNEEQLDDFWCNGKIAPQEIAHGFRAHMVARALLPGDYYHKSDRLTASKNVTRRLLNLLETGK